MTILTVDFGSTFTKAALIADDGAVLGTASTPTTGTRGRGSGDILDGYRVLRDRLDVPHERTSTPARAPAAACASPSSATSAPSPPRQVTASACPRERKWSTSPTGR